MFKWEILVVKYFRNLIKYYIYVISFYLLKNIYVFIFIFIYLRLLKVFFGWIREIRLCRLMLVLFFYK